MCNFSPVEGQHRIVADGDSKHGALCACEIVGKLGSRKDTPARTSPPVVSGKRSWSKELSVVVDAVLATYNSSTYK